MVRNIIAKIFSIFELFFGQFRWKQPLWVEWLGKKFSKFGSKLKASHRGNKPRFYGVLGSGLAVLGILGFFYTQYKNRPQPVRLSVEGSTIHATPLVDEATPETFNVQFGGSAAKLEDLGKVVREGISIHPPIPGEWKWASGDALVFTVEKDWPIGTAHKVRFSQKMFPSHVHLETYELPLEAPSFAILISETTFYQDPKKAKEKKVISEVRFSHPVDPQSLSKNIKLTFEKGSGNGRKVLKTDVGFEVTYDKYFGKAFIHSKILAIPNYDSRILVEVLPGVRPQNSKKTTTAKREGQAVVPGMLTHFRFVSADLSLVRNPQFEPEQVLVLSSSAAVKPKDLNSFLDVYILPKDRPLLPGRKKIQKKFHWRVETVSREILGKSQKLELEGIPTENETAQVISYKYKGQPGRFIYVHVKKGLAAFGGYKLPEDTFFVLRVPEFPQELKIMAEGALLSLSGEKKLSILARDMTTVRYRAQRLLPGKIVDLLTQSYGKLKQPSFNGANFNFDNLTETISEIQDLPVVGEGKTQYSHFDFSKAILKSKESPRGLFQFVAEGWDKDLERPVGPSDRRFILVTDLGLLAKKSIDKSYDVFVQSVATGLPVAGAQVQVLGKNGLPIFSKTSDSRGHIWFPSMEDFENEKAPIVFVATKGNDLSFLPLTGHVYRLNYSRFDVGGTYSGGKTDPLTGYLFSDRGLYRPGERANIGYIIKHSQWTQDLSGLSFEMVVTDPKGITLRNTKNIKLNGVGFGDYDFQTGIAWATGTYNFAFYLRKSKHEKSLIGSTSIRVEEFVPDRMKIAAKFSVPVNKGWLHPNDLKGLVNLQNLFGTPAQNRRVVANLSLTPTYPSFRAFKEWTFYDPLRSKKSFRETLGEQITDQDGDVVFDLGLDKYESASYRLKFFAEGFEAEGGRSVLASNSVLISPLPYLVGYKGQGALNYLSKDVAMKVDIVALDPQLKKIKVSGLKLKWIEFRQVSTLVKQTNGTYKYESVKKEYEKGIEDFQISADGASIELRTGEQGDYALVLLNGSKLELNRIAYSVAGASNLSFNLEKNAELQVKLNKADFDPGETVEIQIRSPYIGAGIITVERERIYSYHWFTTTQKSSLHTIQIPKELEGNGYINVTFVRSLASDEIFMSPLSSGVAPFSINKTSRVNAITLKVPELVRPGAPMAINISAVKKGKAVVFAVDEGILQAANYKNPDPLGHFYKKRALEVETRQILDLILPEFSKLENRRSSESGGASGNEAKDLLGKNLNPFRRKRDKAVAYWSGVLDVGPESQVLTYDVPDYFAGQLRVVAVAISTDAMDAVSDKTFVKGHFILSPNIPNFVAPGDKLKVSVGVANNVEQSGKQAQIRLTLTTSNNINIEGEALASLKIDENSESSMSFDILATGPLGNAEISFEASLGDKKSQRKVTASLRPASPYRTSVQTGILDSGEKISLLTPRRVFENFRTNEVTMSKLPMGMAGAFLTYLEKYPYGCTEQVVSKGFPLIVLKDNSAFSLGPLKRAQRVQRVAEVLASRQLPEGGFAKWPGLRTANAFHTAYAAHYMTEAQDRGFAVGEGLMDRTLDYLKGFSEREPESLEMARVQAYAAYILTRNERVTTKALAALESWMSGYEDKNWVQDITVLYMASSYQLMKASAKAVQLLDKFDHSSPTIADYQIGVYDDSIKKSMHLYLVAKHFPDRVKNFDSKALKPLVGALGKSYNTTSSALAILAFAAYGQIVGVASHDGLSAKAVVGKATTELSLAGTLFPKATFPENTQSVQLNNKTKSVSFYALTQGGFDKIPQKEALSSGMEVFREFLGSSGKVVSKAKIGEELTVRLRFRALGKSIFNVAIVDLLPGGFEVVGDSIQRGGGIMQSVDIREDRVLLFTNFRKEVRTYEYKIKAINKGEFQVPAIFAESMYDINMQAQGVSSYLQIL